MQSAKRWPLGLFSEDDAVKEQIFCALGFIIQINFVFGFVMLGIAMIGVTFQGQSQATTDFAIAGAYSFAFVFGLVLFLVLVDWMLKGFSKAQN